MSITTDTNSEPVAGPVERPVRPTDDAQELADLHVQRARLLQRLADVQGQINSIRARISEAKKRAKEAAKRPKPPSKHLKHRNVSMALLAVEGATVAQVAAQFELSSERVRQCIDKVFRMSMHPRRWDATDGAEHPRALSAARMKPEPLASVLRKMLEEA